MQTSFERRGFLAIALAAALIVPVQGQQQPGPGTPLKVVNPWPQLKRGENGLVRRFVAPKPDHVTIDNPAKTMASLFVLKFVEGTHIRLIDGQLIFDEQNVTTTNGELYRLTRAGLKPATVASQLDQLNLVLAAYSAKYGFNIARMFADPQAPDLSDDQFVEKSELEQRADEELADLDLYYAVYASGFKDTETEINFMNELNKFDIVERVYPAVVAEPAQTSDPPTRDINSLQSYLDPAPGGLDGRFAATQGGGLGDGIKMIDVEYDWVMDHEDFPNLSNLFWGGRPACPYVQEGSDHGTAVMGIVASPNNGFGITGFAPNVHYGLSSVCRPLDLFWAAVVATFSGENIAGRAHNVLVANAISSTLDSLSTGDVLLIEQHTVGPSTGRICSDGDCDQWEFVPMEFYQETFDIVRRATARGIVVVEAGGNGGQNLDDPIYENRFNPSSRNSQAILVGASVGGGSTMPAAFTNSSRRIDLFAWGGNVVTLGFQTGSGAPFTNSAINRRYTSDFSGTSSASAITAGAVVSFQGIRRSVGLLPFTAWDVRNALVSTGTPQTAGTESSQPIGRQPDLRAAMLGSIPRTFTGTGIYTIQSVSSGKVLDIDISWWAGQNNGQKCQQWASTGGTNQQFRVLDNGDGYYSIQAVHSGKLLDVADASLDNGAHVNQFQPNGGRNQEFSIVLDDSVGAYRIIARHSGKVLDVPGGSTDDGVRIQQFDSNGGRNQLFRFIQLTR